jgi:hypothetical protein
MAQDRHEDVRMSEPAIHTDSGPQPLGVDTPCRLCGYNLRGLPSDGRCPECGAMVSASLGQYSLAFADPKWVTALLRGVRIYLVSFVLLFVSFLALIPLTINSDEALLIFSASVLAFIGCFTIGGWLLSAPDPSGLGELEYGIARKIARWALILGTMQGLFDLTAICFADALPRWSEFVLLETWLAQIIGIVGIFSHLHYLQKLTLRIPDPDTSRWARFLKFALGGLWGFLYLWSLPKWPHGTGLGSDLVYVCMGLASLFALVFGVSYLILMARLAGSLATIVYEGRAARLEAMG